MRMKEIHQLYDYHYGVFDRIWDSIMELSEEQFVQDLNYSIGSVRNHMIHLISAERRWVARLQDTVLPEHLTFEEFTERQVVRDEWEKHSLVFRDYLQRIEDVQLDQVLHFNFPHRGGKKQSHLWEALVHIMNHGTDHRAQLLRMLHDFGASTFEQDMILYFWDLG